MYSYKIDSLIVLNKVQAMFKITTRDLQVGTKWLRVENLIGANFRLIPVSNAGEGRQMKLS